MGEAMYRTNSPSLPGGALTPLLRFCLENRLVVLLGVVLLVGWGLAVAPFDWDWVPFPRSPVPVDAIPDLGENQQIVFTEWPGRSPQDMEDQVTYPLTVAMLGVPGVKSVRSQSMFGFSSVNVIFEEDIDFYWSRSRILEKLSSLGQDALPEGVAPALGPDATALGQVFWYTLEGRDPAGHPAGGWDPQELRSIQDWYVRYALESAPGVSQVASVGGFVKEYQIDVDPDAMRAHGVTLDQVFRAIQRSNVDVGARTIEVNRVEYVIRGLGFFEGIEDIERTVLATRESVPVTVDAVANVSLGPALRRGALDKEGAEAVGGVAVVRFGANPLEVIKGLKKKIEETAPGLPEKAVIDHHAVTAAEVEAFAAAKGIAAGSGSDGNQEAWLAWLRTTPQEDWPGWVTLSKVTVAPFYDRTGLIRETLGTLEHAIVLQVLITVLVVLVMLMHLRSALLISAVLPLSVLGCFIGMKVAGVDANIVALSGIAIAIGTIVDMGVILCENILKRLREADAEADRLGLVLHATGEVGGAVVTAIATTVVSFLPVFTMMGAEGKLFRPLAWTKTFALVASVVIALTVLPVLAHALLAHVRERKGPGGGLRRLAGRAVNIVVIVAVGYLLTERWLPLGPSKGLLVNGLFVALLVGTLLFLFHLFMRAYPRLLRWCLDHKTAYLCFPVLLVLVGAMVWLGADRVLGFVPEAWRGNAAYGRLNAAFPGLGKQFMPPLDEGSFLYMPTTMPHASIGEVLETLQLQDRAFAAIPEVDSVVGKIGRVESPLDPAPVSMIETVINYKPEYKIDEKGRRMRFRYDWTEKDFIRGDHGELVPDSKGLPYRQWREHIKSPDDIWQEILAAGEVPGVTSAPKLQPIMTRIIMLQTGMRAPMGVKVRGPDLETIERTCLEVEQLLADVPGVSPATVYADRIVGKPYLEIDIDREAIARYGMHVRDVQDVIEVAVGGRRLTTTVEGRERYPVRVRYQRELRDSIESLGRILVPSAGGVQVPLTQLAEIRYVRGPQVIRSEDTFLVGYVTFDKADGYAEVDVVEACRAHLEAKRDSGEWAVPAGVSYAFAGNYENQVRASKTLAVVLPLALFVIFVILYLQFRSVLTTGIVFCGIAVAWAGGFLLLWCYGQAWFLDFSVAGASMRELFQVQPVMLSVAVWVGFLALFGIATDDGVVMATYLEQRFRDGRPGTVEETRRAVLDAGVRRIRPCLMTTATTILALLPVLTSTGRGADVMVPMAIPTFGGMAVALLTLFLVPVLYCLVQELRLMFRKTAPVAGD